MTTPKNRFKLIPAVHLFLMRNNKILFGLRKNTGYEDGKFHLIAGHADGAETLRHAMTREAKEEIGITIKEKDLIFTHVMHRITNDERLDFFFICKKWSGQPENMEPEKCEKLEWFSKNKLPKNIIPYVKTAIKNLGTKTPYSEYGW